MEETVTGTAWGGDPTKEDRGVLVSSWINITTSRHEPPKGHWSCHQPAMSCWQATGRSRRARARARAPPEETGFRSPCTADQWRAVVHASETSTGSVALGKLLPHGPRPPQLSNGEVG